MWILWNSMGMMVPTRLETTIAMIRDADAAGQQEGFAPRIPL